MRRRTNSNSGSAIRYRPAQELAQQYGLPLKSILLAVHLRVLSLLSGQRNVISGECGTAA